MVTLAIMACSVIVFFLIAWWCRRQGLFDPGSMGFGRFIAFLLFAIFWLAPTVVALVLRDLLR
jgi:hypothetical protein